MPTGFSFGAPKIDGSKCVYQRYVDVDLVSVEQHISLEERYGEVSYAWTFSIIGGLLLAAGLLFFSFRRLGRRESASDAGGPHVPEHLTAFTVLGLLKSIDRDDHLSQAHRAELATLIERLEQHYFQGEGEAEPNLRAIAEEWIGRLRA